MSLRRSSRISTSAGVNGSATAADDIKQKFTAPTTPRKKRKLDHVATPPKPPPFTPTPSAVGFMTAKYSTGDIDDAIPPPVPERKARLAEPHMTNAPLKTPRGSKVIAVPPGHASASSIHADDTTTENLLQKACAHLIKMDPRLKVVIEKHPCRIFSPEGLAEEVDPFRSLTSGIMAQQVSGAAAKSIKAKFVALFNEGDVAQHVYPTPEQVAATDLVRLRTAGLSGRKAEYIKGLAEKFESGELTAQMLAEASDEEVLERLIAVRGLGKWSVEMFACFGLKRLDIISVTDLGVQRGMAAFFGRDVAKLKSKGGGKWKYMSEKDMLDYSAKFAPYRQAYSAL